MCTAVSFKSNGLYFGRSLDNDFSYGEEVAVIPRGFSFEFKHAGVMKSHYAIIGMAFVAQGYPLLYDGMNEKGLCMAGLNFVGNAVYNEPLQGKDNIAQFEFIPWVLGQCSSVNEAKAVLDKINLTNTPFSENLPVAQLHWIIADKNSAITVEAVGSGLNVYDNPAGVLANNPTFDKHMFLLGNYMNLTAKAPENRFSDRLDLRSYSLGMGAIGLPGDLSSTSRFIRAAFMNLNSFCEGDEKSSVGQFFHIMDTVSQPKGCSDLGGGKYEATLYTSCCSADKGIYYYTTYNNRQITAVNMHKENLDGCDLARYPLINDEQIKLQN